MSAPLLDDILGKLGALPEKRKLELVKEVDEAAGDMLFIPNPGPQTDAYLSKADVLLYGGQAGGGKSTLELGWCMNEANSGIIFRRELTQTDGLEKEGKKLIGDSARFNGQDLEWTWPNGRTLKLGGMKQPGDWVSHAGRERDCFCFDEAGEFLEVQVASIIAWLRAEPGRRTRVILGSNPPRTTDGLWLIKWFAPWLDDKYPDPAIPGELRYAIYITRDDGEGILNWVEGPGEYDVEGELYTAKSYTFIPASLNDNPYRDTPEYRAQLQSLPEPLRSQLLYGKFATSLEDLANQYIPTSWVRRAQEAWTEVPPKGVPMCCMGVDASGGGKDPMVIAPRYDGWFPPLIKVPAKDIPKDRAGAYCAGVIVSHRRDQAHVVIDLGGGYGSSMYEHLKENEAEVSGYKGAEGTTKRSRDAKLKFVNKRSAAYWLFREALDPGQPGGSPILLPKDNRLLAGLTAPTFEVTPNGIKVEPKVKFDSKGKIVGGVMSKLGFSPDEADAVVMSWFEGARHTTHALDWIDKSRNTPKIVGGREPLSRRIARGKHV